MSTEVFYFSGTGNSLAVARDIAVKIGATLTPIGPLMSRAEIRTPADVVGIVFPVYNVAVDGLPKIVREFVEKLEFSGSPYIFAVCTCGGGSGATISTLQQLLSRRNQSLSLGYTVILPSNVRATKPESQKRMFDKWAGRLPGVCADIESRRAGHFETTSPLFLAMFAPLAPLGQRFILGIYRKTAGEPDLPLEQVLPRLDQSFHVTDKCTGCGTCVSVCPVSNIEIIDSRPAWRHHCANCVACIQWCPFSAIEDGLTNGTRYHHPLVTVDDIANK